MYSDAGTVHYMTRKQMSAEAGASYVCDVL